MSPGSESSGAQYEPVPEAGQGLDGVRALHPQSTVGPASEGTAATVQL